MIEAARDRRRWLEYFFLFSVIVGSAFSYGKIYFFHLVLVALLVKSGLAVRKATVIDVPKSIRGDVAFFLFFLGWYGLSILWAQDKPLALQYCAYVGLGTLTVYYTATISRTLERMRAALWIVIGTVSLEIVLAIMEGARLIRLPFSPYSPYRWIFGREPSSFEGFRQSQIDQILGVPTGFMGNPNNLTACLVLVLPMFLFAKRWWVAALGGAAIFYIITMAGARAGIIGFWVVMALGMAFYAGHRLRTGAIALLVVAATVGGGLLPDPAFLTSVPQASVPVPQASVAERAKSEVEAYSGTVTRLSEGLLSGAATGKDSIGIRTQLILNGLDALRETYGLGVGAGGSLTVQRNAASERIGEIGSMHNFWVELLVDGGVLFAALFFLWSGWLVWRLWQIGRSSEETILRYLGQALSLGFIGFFFGAIGPSSVIYMLPMWMVIGLGLAVIRLNAEARSMQPSLDPAIPGLAIIQ